MPQVPAGERGLEQVRRVHGALRAARAHEGVQLVDEQDHLAVRLRDLLEHRLQALLELTAVLRTREQAAEVEGHDALVLETLRHVAGGDAIGEALRDRGLAHAGLADEHGVVLAAPREDLDHAADLGVAADDRIELLRLGVRGEIAGVLLEGLEGALGVLAGDLAIAADLLERRLDAIGAGVAGGEERGDLGRGLAGQGEEQVLGRDELVASVGRLLHGVAHDLGEGAARRELAAARPGQLREERLELGLQRLGVEAELREHRRGDALRLRQQRDRQVGGHELGVASGRGELMGRGEGGLGLLGVLRLHRSFLLGRLFRGQRDLSFGNGRAMAP